MMEYTFSLLFCGRPQPLPSIVDMLYTQLYVPTPLPPTVRRTTPPIAKEWDLQAAIGDAYKECCSYLGC